MCKIYFQIVFFFAGSAY